MAKKTDSNEEFRLKPNRAQKGGKGEARAWSTALKTVLRYAGVSRRSQPASKGGGGGGVRKFHQRCAVRIMYSPNKTAGQWRAHGRYIARESAANSVFAQLAVAETDVHQPPVNASQTLDRWQSEGDLRLWKLIVSPEFGERVDLDRLTRELMSRMEKDLGTRLEWVAVAHHNTEHPHAHVALRGIREDKTPLELPRDYVRQGVRAIAEDLCTRQLGHRNHLDAIAVERREIQEKRFTSLDRVIARQDQDDLGDTSHFMVRRDGDQRSGRQYHIDARLCVLQAMGLAEKQGQTNWMVRRDFETVLRAMQRTTDRQKMLASRGALLSDDRLPLAVLDFRRLKTVEGRILAHGEEEMGRGGDRHYLLLEGTDAQIHLIYYTPEMEEARNRGKLRPNAFVRLQKLFENGRPVLDVHDEGDAEKILLNRKHFAERFRTAGQKSRSREDKYGGWLGRYYAAQSASISEAKSGRAPAEKTARLDR